MPGDEQTSRDHFSPVAAAYAEFRPRYPAALFDWLATIAPARDRAWDCACGSGQATLDLARHFTHVEATDLSAEQLARAPAHPQVRYRQGVAEDSGFDTAAFDLVLVAQALHWFDTARFYAEARRVLRPGGVLAAVSYAACDIEAKAGNAILRHYYAVTVGAHWPPERRHVESGYRTLAFPTPELAAPAFTLEAQWTLEQLLGYVRSWSATARYTAATATDPVPALAAALGACWGEPGRRRAVRWPLTVRATLPSASA